MKPETMFWNDPRGFRYVEVMSPGCEGTVNLFWKDFCLGWIKDVDTATEIKNFIDAIES